MGPCRIRSRVRATHPMAVAGCRCKRCPRSTLERSSTPTIVAQQMMESGRSRCDPRAIIPLLDPIGQADFSFGTRRRRDFQGELWLILFWKGKLRQGPTVFLDATWPGLGAEWKPASGSSPGSVPSRTQNVSSRDCRERRDVAFRLGRLESPREGLSWRPSNNHRPRKSTTTRLKSDATSRRGNGSPIPNF